MEEQYSNSERGNRDTLDLERQYGGDQYSQESHLVDGQQSNDVKTQLSAANPVDDASEQRFGHDDNTTGMALSEQDASTGELIIDLEHLSFWQRVVKVAKHILPSIDSDVIARNVEATHSSALYDKYLRRIQ